jgi:hypothetical protein
MPRFRPRFSVRTLAIFVTLVCAYFGAWEATKYYALGSPVKIHTSDHGEQKWVVTLDSCPAPFVLWRDEHLPDRERGYHWPGARRYYLWFFGAEFQLAYESMADMPDGFGLF